MVFENSNITEDHVSFSVAISVKLLEIALKKKPQKLYYFMKNHISQIINPKK